MRSSRLNTRGNKFMMMAVTAGHTAVRTRPPANPERDVRMFSHCPASTIKEKCGVFALFAPDEDVARLTYFGLYSLQHRGQESAGIAVSTNRKLVCYKDMGLVTQAFSEKVLTIMKGESAVGHVRYSTTGSSVERNAQPIVAQAHHHIAVAHNGNLVNAALFRDELNTNGGLKGTTDTEIMAELIARNPAPDLETAITDCMDRIEGAYSVAILDRTGTIYAMRDRHGIRPLCIGRLGNDHGWVVASETCALSIVGAEFVREVNPGELVRIDDFGPSTVYQLESPRSATCVFEFIYFARPDSYIHGRSLYYSRKTMGMNLAKEHPVDADIVMSVPDSGTPAAIGFAQQSGIPYDEGLIKNRYVGRTFIAPDQRIRALGVKIKLNPLLEAIGGKRVVLVDDSIVRGSTSSQIVRMMYDAGAREVHMRVSCPPVKYPCFYGIDMAEASQLIASTRTVEEIQDIIKPDSLRYLSIEGMVGACGLPKERFCTACFNDEYPIAIPQQLQLDKLKFEDPSSRAGVKNGIDLKPDMTRVFDT